MVDPPLLTNDATPHPQIQQDLKGEACASSNDDRHQTIG